MEFHTKVASIPCKCRVVQYTPYKPMQIHGFGMGDAIPPEPEEFDFQILDTKGHPAPWLAEKLTLNDHARLLEEFQLERIGERYGYL